MFSKIIFYFFIVVISFFIGSNLPAKNRKTNIAIRNKDLTMLVLNREMMKK